MNAVSETNHFHWLTPITTITTAPVYASTWLFTLKMHYKQPMMHTHAEVLMQKNTLETFIFQFYCFVHDFVHITKPTAICNHILLSHSNQNEQSNEG